MAEAEYAGMGAFLESVSSSLQGRQREQKRKHNQWMSCIMGGISAEDCTRILGYDPGEEARGGAESIAAGRRAEKEEEGLETRRKFGRETAEKYTTIPVEEAGKLDIPVDWKQAMITPERVTTAVKMTPGQISEAHWKRGGEERDIAKEERGEAKALRLGEATTARQLEKEKEMVLFRKKHGQGETETDRQYAERISGMPKDKRTEFQQGFLDRYEKKTLGLPNLISAYNQAANIMLGGDENSPRAKFLSRRIAKKLATDEDDIELFIGFNTLKEFKAALEESPAHQKYIDSPEVFLDLKNLAEMWYNTYWEEEE